MGSIGGESRVPHQGLMNREPGGHEDRVQNNNVRQGEESAGKEPKFGLLYRNSWQLGDNISVRYAIRYKVGFGEDTVDLGDVFIDLEDCRNLLTMYQDRKSSSGESLVSTVWTVNVLDRELKFCPLTEFVYQAAVVSGGHHSSQLFYGIIKFLVLNLVPAIKPGEAGLVCFQEVNRTLEKHMGRRLRKKRKRRPSTQYIDVPPFPLEVLEAGLQNPTLRLDPDRVEVKDESDPGEEDGQEEDIKSEPEFDVDCWDNYCSSEEEKPKKKTKDRREREGQEYSCCMCGASFKKESFLYLHQVNKHPDLPEQHIPKPTSLSKRGSLGISECKVCGVILRGLTKEYKHYEENHPDYSDRPAKPEYLINKEIELETGEKPRKRDVEGSCSLCNKEFATIKHLYNHCRREHPDRPDICPLEPVRLGPIRTLHERPCDMGGNGDKFQCGLPGCTLLFDRYLSLVDHERTGHPDSYICILCGLACYSADSLIYHGDNLHGKKATYICRVCGFFNRNSRGLTIHTQQEHMKGTLTYQCEKCAYTTGNYVTFGNHKRTAHREENSKFVCEECGNNFATKQSLTSHRRLHNPDFKKFECKYCPQKFGHSSVLRIHMRVHTGEKPFSCNICGASFGSQTASIRHRRVVHANENEMAYQCDDCGKKYPSRAKRDFENHCKTHTGVRDHVCELCGSAYFSKKGLRKHERAVHPSQKPMKPKPFKIGGDSQEDPDMGLEADRSVLGESETASAGFLAREAEEAAHLNHHHQQPSYEHRNYIVFDRREDLMSLAQPPEGTRDTIMILQNQDVGRDGMMNPHQVPREVTMPDGGPRDGVLHSQLPRGEGMQNLPAAERDGDMNVQLAYAAATALHREPPRMASSFFNPLRHSN